MIKEIKYSGLTASPSDYDSPDGELSAVMDLWSTRGAMKPVLKPRAVATLPSGHRVIYIHKMASETIYIIYNSTHLYWARSSSVGAETLLVAGIGSVTDVNAVGSTLIVSTPSGLRYYLWKSNGYIALGDTLPEIKLSFGLRGEFKKSERYTITPLHAKSQTEEFTEEDIELMTNAVIGKINKFIAEESVQKGRFMFPFMVRYALRLYDGSLTRHSAPVLMIPTNGVAPAAYVGLYQPQVGDMEFEYYIVGATHKLDYAVIDGNLGNWTDIVKSIDVFCSAPFYTFDMAGKVKGFAGSTGEPSKGVFKLDNADLPTTYMDLKTRYQVHDIEKVAKYIFTDLPQFRFALPTKGADALDEYVRSCGSFYRLASINVNDLASSRTIIDVPEDYLQSLVNREVMTDDYDSHDRIITATANTYNQRLNLANITKQIFNGFDPRTMICYSNGYRYVSNGVVVTDDTLENVTIYVHTREMGQDIVLYSGSGSFGKNAFSVFPFLYYPSINGYRMSINGSNVTLKPHDFLNGSYFAEKGYTPASGSGPSTTGSVIIIPNRVMTSEVNNPFFFPVANMVDVGVGKIIGMASATKALSQGQFGQFPLYIFSDDGIWALEVANDGTWSAAKPVTRDVCLDKKSITQLDSAVLFSTDRGIMLISGSDTKCITDVLDNDFEEIFSLKDAPLGDVIVGTEDNIDRFTPVPFREFLEGAMTLYDYRSQRLIVYNPSKTYAYVYTLDGSRKWGMMRSEITSHVNSYPEALAMLGDRLVDYSGRANNPADPQFQLLVSRPLKLGAPDILKTVDCIVTRGNFQKGHVQTVLYGSRDLEHWYAIWTSKDHYLRGFSGTPYKYFRVLLKCKLTDGESIAGSSIEFRTKEDSQLK